MKKALIAVSGLLVLTFVLILTISAQNNDQKSKKPRAEISQNIAQCPSVAKCQGLTASKMANCCGGNCAAMNCNAAKCKAGKCDPATCKGGKCDPATCNGGKCDQATCKTNCSGASTSMRGGPMNCNKDIAVAAK